MSNEILECAGNVYDFFKMNYPRDMYGREVSVEDRVNRLVRKTGFVKDVERVDGMIELYKHGGNSDVEYYVEEKRLGSDCMTWRFDGGARLFRASCLLESLIKDFDMTWSSHFLYDYSTEGRIGWKSDFYEGLENRWKYIVARADEVRVDIGFDLNEGQEENDVRMDYLLGEIARKDEVVPLLEAAQRLYLDAADLGREVLMCHEGASDGDSPF